MDTYIRDGNHPVCGNLRENSRDGPPGPCTSRLGDLGVRTQPLHRLYGTCRPRLFSMAGVWTVRVDLWKVHNFPRNFHVDDLTQHSGTASTEHAVQDSAPFSMVGIWTLQVDLWMVHVVPRDFHDQCRSYGDGSFPAILADHHILVGFAPPR